MLMGVYYIVPTYNCSDFLTACIDSLLNQDFKGPIVVVDDGSTDNTQQVLDIYKGKIHTVKQEHKGANAARNAGLKFVEDHFGIRLDTFLSFCDSDAVYYPDFGSRLHEALQGNMDACSYGWWEAELDDGQIRTMRIPEWDHELIWWDICTIPMPSMIRAIQLPHNNLDETNKWRDDWKLWLWMAERGHKGRCVQETLFRHRFRHDGKTRELSRNPNMVASDRASARRRFSSLSRLPGPVASLVFHPDNSATEAHSGDARHCLGHLLDFSGVPMHVMHLGEFPNHNTFTHQPISSSDIPSKVPSEHYLLLLRSDAFIGPECVERLLWWLRMMPSLGAVGPMLLDDSAQSVLELCKDETATDELKMASALLPDFHESAKVLRRKRRLFQMPVSPACAMVRPEAVPLINWSDGVWCDPMTEAGFDVAACHDALCLYGEASKRSYWEQ